MVPRLGKLSIAVITMLSTGLASGASDKADTPEAASPSTEQGMLMLDHQRVGIKGYESIDLLGFHVFKQFDDWLYAGIGGHAPLATGDYGGFMVFDVSVLAKTRIYGRLSANVGASFGGGGGGHSQEQSKVISGTGDFQKAFVGLGYDFNDFSAGVDFSNIRQSGSAIHNSQFGFYVQTPISYHAGSYADAGRGLSLKEPSSAENVIEIGLDNIVQVKPKGTYTKSVNLADLQFDHFISDNSYVLVEGDVGYRGLPLYNQIFAGLGYRYAVTPRVSARGQLSVGSGGYDPEKINTGSGLLIYPKASIEYMLDSNFGLALSGGYLYAPNGSSRNLTVGALLNYHDSVRQGAPGATPGPDAVYKGYRFSVFTQSESDVKVGSQKEAAVRLLSIQLDKVIHPNFYIPIQASVAYSSYFGYAGYGELLAGVGVQSEHSPHSHVQAFAEMLVGTNVRGLTAKPAVGLEYELTDQLAVHAQLGTTISKSGTDSHPSPQYAASTTVGLGLSYRFALARQ